MLSRSPRGASAATDASAFFSTGTLSPVSDASSTRRLTASSEAHVGGHEVAGLEQHHVAGHQLPRGHDQGGPVAQHAGIGRGHLLQGRERLLGLRLLHHADHGVQDDDQDDGARVHVLSEHDGDDRGRDQDQDQEVLELAEEHGEERRPRLLHQLVAAVLREAARRLGRREAPCGIAAEDLAGLGGRQAVPGACRIVHRDVSFPALSAALTILLRGYSMMPSAPHSMRRGTSSRTALSRVTISTENHWRVPQAGHGGRGEAGQQLDHLVHARLGHVHLQADHAVRGQRAVQQHGHALDLRSARGIAHAVPVRDQLGVGLEQGGHDLQPVRLQGRAGLGDVDHRVDQALDGLGLGGAPRELDLDRDVPLGEVAPGIADQLGGDGLPRAVLDPVDGAAGHRREHPARLGRARLRVHEVGYHLDVRVVLEHPVEAGEARVEHPALHVAGHLLRAHQGAGDLGIVDRRHVRALGQGDFPAGLAEQLDGGTLEAALRDAQADQRVAHRPAPGSASSSRSAPPSTTR